MLPILIASRSSKSYKKYIRDYIKKHNFHPSHVFHLEKEKSAVTIDQIRNVQSLLSRSAQGKRCVVIYEFDTAKKETQNSFLKTLEEKNKDTQFILTVTDIAQVLPTISSRSHVVHLHDESVISRKFIEKYKLDKKHDSLSALLNASSHVIKPHAHKLLHEILSSIHISLIHKKNKLAYAKAAEKIMLITYQSRRNNVYYEYALDNVLIQLYDNELLPLTSS